MVEKIVCYSIGCPQCLILERKLKQKNIDFELVSDTNVMKEKGFTSAPKLEVGNTIMDFKKAVEWIKEQ